MGKELTELNRTDVINLLIDLGFKKADGWSPGRVKEWIRISPSNVPRHLIPKKHQKTFDKILEAAYSDTIKFVDDYNEKKRVGRWQKLDKDEWGCRIGSIRNMVNKVLPRKEWKTERQIADEAGVSLYQARLRLYRLYKDGKLEKENEVKYRVKE